MSLPHPGPGEPIDVRPLGPRLGAAASTALFRTDDVEVMRLVLPKGKSVPEHHVEGEMTLQCLEGTVDVQTGDQAQRLSAGEMLYLYGHTPYSLSALEDASLLMTMLRKGENSKDDD
ncbi:MAG TPA: cupin domain-containing protein [Noviherbaspirillum sp.]|jgi:quercetin dioxygenase-like cupin family protein|uniref:cupin domain-containing protein n=1 Tax=Noviherbaspirillum sp. TaxID=1926288 RepID=UPI002F94865C